MSIDADKVLNAFLAREPKYGRFVPVPPEMRSSAYRDKTDGLNYFLWNSRIAWHSADGGICLTLAGYDSALTRSRLNDICEKLIGSRPFYQRLHKQYFDDRIIYTDSIITIYPLDLAQAA